MPHYLTKDGLEKLKQDLHHMKSVVRKEVVERIASAKELGDLKENAEYAEAKDDQALLEARILEFEMTVKDVVVIEESHGQGSTVTIGSTVVIILNGVSHEYTIVGSEEADPVAKKISHESPYGKAFLGRKKGDTVSITAPVGTFECTIKDIK